MQSRQIDVAVAPQDDAHMSPQAAYWALFVLTAVYALNIADRYILSTLIEPIRHEFQLSDSALGLVTGVGLAIFYVTAGIPLGVLADKVNRRRMILAALTAWSVMTALCGMAQNFWHLLIARTGVGVGEAGGTPPSQSLMADYFPPERRALAASLFSLGVPIGSAVGGIVAASVAEVHGWRSALLVAAAMSIPVVLLVLTLKEPRRGRFDPQPTTGDAPTGVGLRTTLRFILGNNAVFHVIAGATVATFSGMGLVWWSPAFLARSHGMSVGDAGVQIGLMNGIGGTIAMLASAAFMIVLARRPTAALATFLAVITGMITIPAVTAHAVSDRQIALINLWLLIALANIYIGPTLALLNNLFPPTMRATAVAIVLFTANIANLVIAPQGIGFLSDRLRPLLADPESSLRYALLACAFTGIWGAIHFMLAARALRERG
ncbi:MFS transporter [Sphingomonas sp. MG17]|uniref:MFS transporter n=1 Tax=Sphingomonas tagetis TaxID=2949092 RepID=A0A9X2HK73_9SPHN|nr:MFS transporter [Sphingomonas tagetis]MCP3732736.1 MFS transporter [Sphingomonas tagetis]